MAADGHPRLENMALGRSSAGVFTNIDSAYLDSPIGTTLMAF